MKLEIDQKVIVLLIAAVLFASGVVAKVNTMSYIPPYSFVSNVSSTIVPIGKLVNTIYTTTKITLSIPSLQLVISPIFSFIGAVYAGAEFIPLMPSDEAAALTLTSRLSPKRNDEEAVVVTPNVDGRKSVGPVELDAVVCTTTISNPVLFKIRNSTAPVILAPSLAYNNTTSTSVSIPICSLATMNPVPNTLASSVLSDQLEFEIAPGNKTDSPECFAFANVPPIAQFGISSTSGNIIRGVENYITPNSAGISMNGQNYPLYYNVTDSVNENTTYNFSLQLTNVSYIPIEHTVSFNLCASTYIPGANVVAPYMNQTLGGGGGGGVTSAGSGSSGAGGSGGGGSGSIGLSSSSSVGGGGGGGGGGSSSPPSTTTTITKTTTTTSHTSSTTSTSHTTSTTSTSQTTSPTSTVSQNTGPGSSGGQVMINYPSWNGTDGFSSIQWSDINEIDIFHVWPEANGSIEYDGGLSNLASIISTAHSHNVKVALAVGGDGVDPSIINSVLANATLRKTLIRNIVRMTTDQGYDGVQIDFEGNFNSGQFTTFMQQLSASLWAKNPNAIINIEIAPYEISSFNLPALAPYATQFDVMADPTMGDLAQYANEVGGSSMISAGYDLTTPSDLIDLATNLIAAKQAGYGIFFWNSEVVTPVIYKEIAAALSV